MSDITYTPDIEWFYVLKYKLKYIYIQCNYMYALYLSISQMFIILASYIFLIINIILILKLTESELIQKCANN